MLTAPVPQDNKPHELQLSEEADKMLTDIFDWLEPQLVDELSDMNGWAEKLNGEIARFAGLLHCATHGDKAIRKPVSGKIMRRAIKIGKYFLAHAQNAHAIMGANKGLQAAKTVLRKLQSQTEAELSKYQIFRMCRGLFQKVDDTLPALDILIEHGYIREVVHTERTGGRPKSSTYQLNPLYLKKLAGK